MKIFLVRHGSTLWNQELRYQGQTDIELSEQGREQAALAADYLKGQNIQALYCSDLRRCIQTAKIIGDSVELEAIIEPRFREISFGIWEGLTYAEAKARYPELVRQRIKNTLNFQIPRGESLYQGMERAWEAWEEILPKPHDPVAIITHGGIIKVLLHKAGVMTIDEFWGVEIKPASITMLDTDTKQRRFLLPPLNNC